MNPTEASQDPLQNNAVRALQRQFDSLRKLLIATLLFLLVLSGSVNLYLLRQMISARKDLTATRPRVQQMVSDYQRNEEPAIKAFVNNLQAFATTHPDFTVVLAKYKIPPASAVVNRAPPVAPSSGP